jgi:hypothetical protein
VALIALFGNWVVAMEAHTGEMIRINNHEILYPSNRIAREKGKFFGGVEIKMSSFFGGVCRLTASHYRRHFHIEYTGNPQ